MTAPDFGSLEFWESNALEPKDEYVEWLCDYEELARLLRCCCDGVATVLHVGCGISTLSGAMHADGLGQQLAVDFSAHCVAKQREQCAAAGCAVMDVTRLALRAASVDVCVDKGTLDCLLCTDAAEEAAAALSAEVRRVLRHEGLWLVVSFHTPQVVLPLLSPPPDAAERLLVATHCLFSGNGVHYAFTCKLLRDEGGAAPDAQLLASARRGWVRAAHGPVRGLRQLGARGCAALDEEERPTPSAAPALLPLLLSHALVPVVGGGNDGSAGAEEEASTPPPPPPPLGAPAHRASLALLQVQRRGLAALPDDAAFWAQLPALRTLDGRSNALRALPAALPAALGRALRTLLRRRASTRPAPRRQAAPAPPASRAGAAGACGLAPAPEYLPTLPLDRNALEALPDDLGRLAALTTLSATHNRLRALPASWRQLGALRTLRLQHNPLSDEQRQELSAPRAAADLRVTV